MVHSTTMLEAFRIPSDDLFPLSPFAIIPIQIWILILQRPQQHKTRIEPRNKPFVESDKRQEWQDI